MKPKLFERVASYHTQPLAHEAMTLMAGKRVVVQIAATEYATHNVGDVDHTGKLPIVVAAHEEGRVFGLQHTLQIRREFGWRAWWRNPWVMKAVTRRDCSEK